MPHAIVRSTSLSRTPRNVAMNGLSRSRLVVVVRSVLRLPRVGPVVTT